MRDTALPVNVAVSVTVVHPAATAVISDDHMLLATTSFDMVAVGVELDTEVTVLSVSE